MVILRVKITSLHSPSSLKKIKIYCPSWKNKHTSSSECCRCLHLKLSLPYNHMGDSLISFVIS